MTITICDLFDLWDLGSLAWQIQRSFTEYVFSFLPFIFEWIVHRRASFQQLQANLILL